MIHVIPLALLKGILILRLDVAATDFNGIEFVVPDATIQQLLPARRAIKKPFAFLHERNWKRPVFTTHKKEGSLSILWVQRDAHLLTRFFGECNSPLSVLREFSRKDNVFAVSSEDMRERGAIELFCGAHQSIGSLLWRVKGFYSCRNAGGDRLR